MPEPEFEGREVSCGVFSGLLAAVAERGLSVEEFVAGTGYSVAHFEDPTERVRWQALQLLGERAMDIWTADEMRAIGVRSLGAQHFEPQVLLARLLMKPTEAYGFIVRGDSQGDFACVGVVTETSGQHVQITATITPGYGHAPGLFWILAGAAEALPTLFGLGPASVVVELTEDGAVYDIDVPPGGGPLSWLRRGVLALRNRSMEVQDLPDRLFRRTEALETQIAKRVHAEAELRAHTLEHERRFEHLRDVVVELDEAGAVAFASPNLGAVLSVDPDRFRADPWSFLGTDPASGGDGGASDGEASPDRPWTVRLEGDDDSARWIEVSPSRYVAGTSERRLFVLRDVTERLELAADLERARRFESLGVMASGVAHDFNNLLVPILGNVGLVLDSLPPESTHAGPLRAIEAAARHAAELTEQILASTGMARLDVAVTDIAAVVDDLSTLLADLVPPHIEFTTRTPPTAIIEADPAELRRVLTNLTVNAVESIGAEPGTISLVLSRDDDATVLEMTDSGSGMTAEARERMFEPFFTTKPGGRGLGLASLSGMIRSGGVAAHVRSGPGAGTTIRLSFKSSSVRGTVSPSDAGDDQARLAGTILVVDDNEFVLDAMAAMVAASGAAAEPANSGRDARARIEQVGPIDCVVIDLTMPDTNGAEAIVDLRGVQPDLPAVLVTGAGNVAAMDALEVVDLLDDVVVLEKPFKPDQLLTAVRTAMRTTSP